MELVAGEIRRRFGLVTAQPAVYALDKSRSMRLLHLANAVMIIHSHNTSECSSATRSWTIWRLTFLERLVGTTCDSENDGSTSFRPSPVTPQWIIGRPLN